MENSIKNEYSKNYCIYNNTNNTWLNIFNKKKFTKK